MRLNEERMILHWAGALQPQMEAELGSMAETRKPPSCVNTYRPHRHRDPFPLDSRGPTPPHSCKTEDREGRRGVDPLLKEAQRARREGPALMCLINLVFAIHL